MTAIVVYAHNPFDTADRIIKQVETTYTIAALTPKTELPYIAVLNGAPVLRANDGWQRTLQAGDHLVFVMRPQGGGGGSNPLKVVLSIALSFAAPGIGAALVGEMAAVEAVAWITFGQLAGGLVAMAGNMVLNAMMPSASPKTRQQSFNTPSASPTYNISAQGNSARLLEPIPVQYGRHLSYPDYAAEPFTEYFENDQYLYQLLCIGQGEYDIESIRIEDTDISHFEEITYQVVANNQSVTLFPSNVITSPEVSGQELIKDTYIGGFIANAAGSSANALGIDVVCGKGLFYANDEGGLNTMSLTFKAEARAVDGDGIAIGSWITLGTETISAATATSIRKSYRYTVTAGRYEVRMTRTDVKNTNSRAGHEVEWVGLKAYLQTATTFGDVTLLAMRMRATNNLSAQTSRRINVIATRKLPVWNGTSWSAPVATRNPAWAMADVLKSIYGAKLSNSRIDLAKLLTLAGTYDARADHFDIRFDSHGTIFEALNTIGEAVRTKPYQQGAVWHFWRDEPQTLPVAMFNTRSIVRGSVKMNYLTPTADTADAIEIEYFNNATWSWDTVTCALPDSSIENIAKKRIIGITEHDHAWREGMYQCAANRYRRNAITFNTEMDGFIPTYGDMVAVQHDRPRWGQAGDVLAYDSGTRVVTTSEPLDFSAGGNHYFRFRKFNGSGTDYYLATAGVDAYHAVLDAPLEFTPTVDGAIRTSYSFGPSTKVDKLCLARVVKPRSLESVELNLIVDDAAVYTADTSAVPPPSINWNLPVIFTRPLVSDIRVTLSGTASNPQINVAWQPAPSADYYHVEYSYDSQLTWQRAGEPIANQITFPAQRSNVYVRVRGVGKAVGDWVQIFASNLFLAPPPDVSSLLVSRQSDGTRQFDWALGIAPPPDLAGYQIRYRTGTNVAWGWADLSPAHDGILTASPWETNQLTAGQYTFAIKAIDDSGIESANATFVIADLGNPRLAGVLVSVLPHTQGWPGTKTGCHLEDASLVANSTATWDSITSWNSWTAWNNSPVSPIIYEHSVIDVGGVLPFTPIVDVIAAGTVLVQESHSNDNVTYTSWATAGSLITARYIKTRITVTSSGIASIDLVNIKLSAESISEEINDLSTSTLSGAYRIGVGDIRLPKAKPYSLITQVQVSLQNVGAGWSWELIDKSTTTGPRIKIYNASNALADASIDAFIRGA